MPRRRRSSAEVWITVQFVVTTSSSCSRAAQYTERAEPIGAGRDRAVGAFELFDQRCTPETVSFHWVMRDDGGSSLDAADPAVTAGTVDDATRIAFGPFRIEWSVARPGSGWLYYAHAVGDDIPQRATRLCVADHAGLAGLDAADERWWYRASLSDDGVRGPEPD